MTVSFRSMVAEQALITRLSKESIRMGSEKEGTEVHRVHTSDLFYIIGKVQFRCYSLLLSHTWLTEQRSPRQSIRRTCL